MAFAAAGTHVTNECKNSQVNEKFVELQRSEPVRTLTQNIQGGKSSTRTNQRTEISTALWPTWTPHPAPRVIRWAMALLVRESPFDSFQRLCKSLKFQMTVSLFFRRLRSNQRFVFFNNIQSAFFFAWLVQRDELREIFNDISSSSEEEEDEGDRHEDEDLNIMDTEDDLVRQLQDKLNESDSTQNESDRNSQIGKRGLDRRRSSGVRAGGSEGEIGAALTAGTARNFPAASGGGRFHSPSFSHLSFISVVSKSSDWQNCPVDQRQFDI